VTLVRPSRMLSQCKTRKRDLKNVNTTPLLRPKIIRSLKKRFTERQKKRVFLCFCSSVAIFFLARSLCCWNYPIKDYEQQRDFHDDDVLLLHLHLLPVFFFVETVEAKARWTRRREKKEFREIFNIIIIFITIGGKSG